MGAPEHEQEITRLLASVNTATKASDYADTVIMAPTQIDGTRYKYVLTSAPDPRQA